MSERPEVIKVGIADLNIVKAPNSIRTSGLGSCVGAVIYDPALQLAGMVHVMLPNSELAKGSEKLNRAKFADTGIQQLFELLVKNGAQPSRMKAKIAGGAQMFQFSSSEHLRIGPRNTEAVKEQLKKLSIAVIAEDTGGNSGRTIQFDPATCMLSIRTVNRGMSSL